MANDKFNPKTTVWRTPDDIKLYVSGQQYPALDKVIDLPSKRWCTVLWRYRKNGRDHDMYFLQRFEYQKAYGGYVLRGEFSIGRPYQARLVAGTLWGWIRDILKFEPTEARDNDFETEDEDD